MSVENFIPTLWSTKFLNRLKLEHVYANCVNRDYEGEIKNLGDTVRVNTVGPVTISPYTKNTINLTPEVISGTGQAMVIDKADFFYFALDDVDKAQAQTGLMDGAMEEAAYGMRDKTDRYLADLISADVDPNNIMSTTASPITVGTAAGDQNAYELLVEISTKLNLANVPSGNRWVVVDPQFVGKLLLDDRFASFATAFSEKNITEGSTAGPEGGSLTTALRTLTGFSIKVSNNVPEEVSGVYTIMAGYKGAVSYAEQIAEGSPEAFRLQTGFADAVRGLHLYGGHTFRPAALTKVYVNYS